MTSSYKASWRQYGYSISPTILLSYMHYSVICSHLASVLILTALEFSSEPTAGRATLTNPQPLPSNSVLEYNCAPAPGANNLCAQTPERMERSLMVGATRHKQISVFTFNLIIVVYLATFDLHVFV